MTLETFFEKFDQFADAPDAVAKMRELIMWSAFSGAFSVEERNQPMPKEWAVKDAPTLPAIPSSWKWQRGSAVFDVIRGVSYKKNDASDSPVEGSFPVLRANNIGNGINFDGLVYVPRDNIRDEQFVRRGDILIAMSSGSKKLVGKAAPIITDFIGAFGAFCGIIRNKSAIPDEVLAQYFQSPQYTSWVTAAGRGIGINNLGRGDLDSLPVPTPPLAEQKRIVAKVDELMALCDRLEAQQQERETRHAALARASLARFAEAPTPANLEFLFHKSYAIAPADLRKSILTLAVQGKLVPQDPNDEPAEEREVDALLTENKEPEIEPPFSLPNSWQAARVREVLVTRQGVQIEKAEQLSEPKLGYKRYLYISDFKHDQKLKFVRDEHPTKEVTADDLVMANTAGPGEIFRGVPGILSNNLFKISFAAAQLCQDFLFIYFTSPSFVEAVGAELKGGAQQHLGHKLMGKQFIPVPPLAEQRRIVAKVSELMALVDKLEAQLAASRATAANLLSAIVAELTESRAPVPIEEPPVEAGGIEELARAAEEPAIYG